MVQIFKDVKEMCEERKLEYCFNEMCQFEINIIFRNLMSERSEKNMAWHNKEYFVP